MRACHTFIDASVNKIFICFAYYKDVYIYTKKKSLKAKPSILRSSGVRQGITLNVFLEKPCITKLHIWFHLLLKYH